MHQSLYGMFSFTQLFAWNHDATDSQKQKFFFTEGHFAAEIYTLHQNRAETNNFMGSSDFQKCLLACFKSQINRLQVFFKWPTIEPLSCYSSNLQQKIFCHLLRSHALQAENETRAICLRIETNSRSSLSILVLKACSTPEGKQSFPADRVVAYQKWIMCSKKDDFVQWDISYSLVQATAFLANYPITTM